MNAQAQARKAATTNKGDNTTANTTNTTSMAPINITSIPMATISSNSIDSNAIKSELTTTNCSTDDLLQQIQQQQVLQLQGDCQTICLHVSISYLISTIISNSTYGINLIKKYNIFFVCSA